SAFSIAGSLRSSGEARRASKCASGSTTILAAAPGSPQAAFDNRAAPSQKAAFRHDPRIKYAMWPRQRLAGLSQSAWPWLLSDYNQGCRLIARHGPNKLTRVAWQRERTAVAERSSQHYCPGYSSLVGCVELL